VVAFDLSEEELAKTEAEIGARFPASYRDAMKASNGGTVEAYEDEWELFPIRDTSSQKRISRTTNHVLLETKNSGTWPRFHELAYAIAGNGSGDRLVIFREGNIFEPQVFAWGHEDDSLKLVASDFGELTRV
jgi:hypothetical protein